MRAYSVDVRQWVLADCDAGVGTKAVAEKYQVSRAVRMLVCSSMLRLITDVRASPAMINS